MTTLCFDVPDELASLFFEAIRNHPTLDMETAGEAAIALLILQHGGRNIRSADWQKVPAQSYLKVLKLDGEAA